MYSHDYQVMFVAVSITLFSCKNSSLSSVTEYKLKVAMWETNPFSQQKYWYNSCITFSTAFDAAITKTCQHTFSLAEDSVWPVHI